MKSKAKLDFKTSNTVASQYIDTWIDSYLGYLLGTNSYDEVFIISNDKGFQSMIDLWSDHKISRRKSIALA